MATPRGMDNSMASMATPREPGDQFRITAKEPNYTEVFYARSNDKYSGHWHDGTCGTKVGSVPKISDVLAAKPTIRKPVRPLIASARTMLADAIREEQAAALADKVISADVCPKKFPVQSHQFQYPASAKKGSDNPLYQVSSQVYGNAAPMDHQVSDRYFPSTGHFTKGFVEQKPRFTGLNTGPCFSKFHSSLDEYY